MPPKHRRFCSNLCTITAQSLTIKVCIEAGEAWGVVFLLIDGEVVFCMAGVVSQGHARWTARNGTIFSGAAQREVRANDAQAQLYNRDVVAGRHACRPTRGAHSLRRGSPSKESRIA